MICYTEVQSDHIKQRISLTAKIHSLRLEFPISFLCFLRAEIWKDNSATCYSGSRLMWSLIMLSISLYDHTYTVPNPSLYSNLCMNIILYCYHLDKVISLNQSQSDHIKRLFSFQYDTKALQLFALLLCFVLFSGKINHLMNQSFLCLIYLYKCLRPKI